MTKSFLILMLMTVQLLSGSRMSVYVCVGADGSWFIHPGSDCCKFRQSDESTGCGCCDENRPEDDSLCSGDVDDRLASTIECLIPAGPCDCKHMPVIMASGMRNRVVRASATMDLERLAAQTVLLPFVGSVCPAAPGFARDASETLAAADFFLTVVSTVVIRC